MWGSVEILVLVTLKIGLDELTNWFKMSRVTPPVELNENIQYFVSPPKQHGVSNGLLKKNI
jgi:hypothetical protein